MIAPQNHGRETRKNHLISLSGTVRDKARSNRVSEDKYLDAVADSVGELKAGEKTSFSKLAAIVSTDAGEAAEIGRHFIDYGLSRKEAQVGLGLVVAAALAHTPALRLMLEDASAQLRDKPLPSPRTEVPQLALEPSIQHRCKDFDEIPPAEYPGYLVENASEGWGQQGLDGEHAQSARNLVLVLEDGVRPSDRHYLEQLDVSSGNCDAVAAGTILTDALGLDKSLRPAMERVAEELKSAAAPPSRDESPTYGDPDDNPYGLPTRRRDFGLPGFGG